jgi:hypothetical protein
MKRMITLLMVLLIILCVVNASAANMGVVTIGSGSDADAEYASLDDMKLNVTVSIPNYGDITLLSIEYVDEYDEYYEWESGGFNDILSGADANILMLRFDILNTAVKTKDFAADIKDTVIIFRNNYQYAGYICQYNYDRDYPEQPMKSGITSTIDPMYIGHYVICCYLPNAIVSNTKDPLVITFTLSGHEVVYQVQ